MRYNGNFTWSSVAETLEQQTRYGQGQIGANGGAEYTTSASGSWGPVLDGSQQKAWNGETYAYSKYGNKLEDYSEPLPDALWERLEEELSAPRVIPMWRTRRFVAAAVLVVAVSSLTFWFINSPTADYMRSNEALVEELDFSSTPDDEVLSSSEKIFSSDNSKMDSSDPVVRLKSVWRKSRHLKITIRRLLLKVK